MLSEILFGLSIVTGSIIAYPVHYSQHQQENPLHSGQYQHGALQYQQKPVLHHNYPVEHQTVPLQPKYLISEYHHLPESQYESLPVPYARVQHDHKDVGEQSSSHDSTGHSRYTDEGTHAASQADTHGHHNYGSQLNQGSEAGSLNNHGTYSNVGSYSEDKGSGYEKSYSYDTATGYHDIEAEDSSDSKKHGTKTEQQHHNIGSQTTHEKESKGAHSKTGSSVNESQAYSKQLFEKYGYTNSAKDTGYSYSPLYGFGYH